MKKMSDYGKEVAVIETVDAKLAAQRERDADLAAQRQREADTVRVAKLAAADALEEAHALIGAVTEQRLAGELRDPAKTAQTMATTAAILVDKYLLLEGRPNVITQTNAVDIWASVWRKLGSVDSTAVEIDAE